MDCKDATSVPPDPDGKQLHVVEILNFGDAGTHNPGSWLKPVRIFMRKRRMLAVASFLIRSGRPRRMTFDRDSRLVGSQSLRQFPSAFCRFLLCLGIHPNICPPRRPDKNASVERLHRTLNQECLQVRLPTTLGEVGEATSEFLSHYNHERPQEAQSVWQSPAAYRFPNIASLAESRRPGQSRRLVGNHPWTSVCAQSRCSWQRGRGR